MMNTIVLEREKTHSGTLVLVNGRYPLRNSENMDLAPADARYPDVLLRRDAANILQLVLNKVAAENNIVPVSGYRSMEEQTQIYESSLRENGQAFTEQYVALPNHSEHQTGLAIDLALNAGEIDFLCPDFPYEGICDAFRKAAPDYGFVERYPLGKEYVTGISHEPWHFRYVGFPHSRIMADMGLTLEEYMVFLWAHREEQKFIWRMDEAVQIEICYVPAQPERTIITLPEHVVYQISGDNVDGFVVTVWRHRDA